MAFIDIVFIGDFHIFTFYGRGRPWVKKGVLDRLIVQILAAPGHRLQRRVEIMQPHLKYHNFPVFPDFCLPLSPMCEIMLNVKMSVSSRADAVAPLS